MGDYVFISYSHKDKAVVEKLEKYFQANGIEYWVDHAGLSGGGRYSNEIAEAVAKCSLVLFVLSNESQKSDYVQDEIQYASDDYKKPIFTLYIEDVEGGWAKMRTKSTQNYLFYQEGYDVVKRLINDIKRKMGSANESDTPFSPFEKMYWDSLQKRVIKPEAAVSTAAPPSPPLTPKTVALKILNVILWILFWPAMLMIRVCKSQEYATALKIVLCLILFSLLGSWISLCTMGIASLVVRPKPSSGGSGNQSSYEDGVKELTPIDIDIEELVTPFIKGYNNFGYFDGTVSREGTVDTADGVFSYKFDFTELRDGAAYFKMSIDKDASAIGDAVVSVVCNSLLSNEEILEFAVSGELDGCEINLKNNKFRISTLKTDEFERSDPKDYFVANESREEGFGTKYYKFDVLQSEYTVGTKTVKLSVIEDKRSGAEYVNPGLLFEVYEDGKLLGQGRYVFVARNGETGTSGLNYDADHDDYEMSIYHVLTPDFDQAELLDKTGILFNYDARGDYYS